MLYLKYSLETETGISAHVYQSEATSEFQAKKLLTQKIASEKTDCIISKVVAIDKKTFDVFMAENAAKTEQETMRKLAKSLVSLLDSSDFINIQKALNVLSAYALRKAPADPAADAADPAADAAAPEKSKAKKA